MAARIIESVDVEPAPLRMVLGSQALESTLATLRKRIAGFEAQAELAASTDFPPASDQHPQLGEENCELRIRNSSNETLRQ